MGFAGLLGAVFFASYMLSQRSQNKETNLTQVYYQAWVANRFGLVLMYIACASFVWGVKLRQDSLFPPTNPISPAAFSQSDLTGILKEVLIRGHVQLDQRQSVIFQRDYWLFNNEVTVIPITDANWQAGDPVTLFLRSGSFPKESTPAEQAASLEHEGITKDGVVVTPQTHLMTLAVPQNFKGNVTQTLRNAGINTAPQAYLVDIIDDNRDWLLEKAVSGSMRGAQVLGVLGLLALLGSMGMKGWVRRKHPGFKV